MSSITQITNYKTTMLRGYQQTGSHIKKTTLLTKIITTMMLTSSKQTDRKPIPLRDPRISRLIFTSKIRVTTKNRTSKIKVITNNSAIISTLNNNKKTHNKFCKESISSKILTTLGGLPRELMLTEWQMSSKV